MLTRLRPSDDQSLEALIAPPGLDDGLQSLGYWRERRRRLPWYRRRARREAELMAVRWEGRLGAALLRYSEAPISTRASAAVLVARSRLTRWGRRARVVVIATAITAVVLVAVPLIAGLVLLLHAL